MATILLAEDEDHIGDMVAFKLEAVGHAVARARDGAKALDLARSLRPDLILLDVMMPILDGLQALRMLKDDAALAAIPVIMMTAKGQTKDIQAGLYSGAEDYVVKPFSLKDLVARVGERLEGTVRP